MEQQDPDPPCTPSTVLRDTEHRSTHQSPSSSPSTFTLTPTPQRRTTITTSRPTTPATPGSTSASSNRSSLSTSEPTLRFPLPQGNRHLANWISSSNPDIMRITTTTEDTGLSESTYELISGTDTESQDGNYTESISESVGSLDFHRPDDIHSLAGTEQTYDDESLADEHEPPLQQLDQESESVYDGVDVNQTPRAQQSWASVVKNGPLPEIEPEAEPELEPDSKGEPESESEDEARSRSSLEYTQQSLKTPSIPSPDASNTENKSSPRPSPDDIEEDAESQRARFHKWLKEVQTSDIRPWQAVMNSATLVFPLILALVVASLISVFYSTHSNDAAAPHNPAATSAVTIHPTPLSYTSSQTSLSTSQALSTSTGTAALVPLENALPDEWLWGGKQPEVTVTRHRGDFLVHMPRDVKKSWLDRDCLSFSAKRGDELVRFGTSPVNEGMLIKFPKEEAHGTVKVDIYTTCRPKIRKVLRITFEKGIISEAFELTRAFAHNLPDLVPAAAQEAERRLEGAKRSLEAASDNFMTTSDSLLKDLGVRLYNAHRSLSWIKTDIRDRVQTAKYDISEKLKAMTSDVKQHLPNAEAVQQRAQLELLSAQIRAKLWWLKMTAGEQEHDRYQHAAKQFMATKKLLKNRNFRHPTSKPDKSSTLKEYFSRPWSSNNRRDSQEDRKA
ncbi:hypothetical protein NW762_007298 [Fusarium torreyae]|uniref:Uncharacterized protein n=1 Tax=Fusarium torreyae TaxID=1237075 RepID=A0A9W8S0G9_9HYPO|nr:hypothetical protein NW762_007298 [Fusarium torreyae]